MILKSLSRRSGSKQLLTYLFEKQRVHTETDRNQLLIKHNIRSRSIEGWEKEFAENEAHRLRRRSDNVKMFHTILSFSDKDRKHVTDKVLMDIGRKFIELRGRDSMFLGTAHYEKDHIHLHIAMSGTKYLTGESNRLSRSEFRQLKLSLDEYQKEKYPELSHSLPGHGKPNREHSLEEYELEKLSGRQSQKKLMFETIERIYTKSKSVEHFLSQMKALGHDPYYRAGRLTGVWGNGERKYRFSRLGYDAEKLSELDRFKSKEEDDLKELQDIRERNSSYRSREIEDDEPEKVNDEKEEDEKDDIEERELEDSSYKTPDDESDLEYKPSRS